MTLPVQPYEASVPAAPRPQRNPLDGWMRHDGSLGPASRREQIAVALREAIVRGDIPPGAQLKQDELKGYFRSSPAPVREALRQLESEGLVEHYLNRGAFVSAVSTEELMEVLLPVRLIIERYSFRKVAAHLTDELVAQLRHQVMLMEEGADKHDVAAINEADVRFHELVVQASGSFHTVQLWKSVLPRIRVQFYLLAPRHQNLREIAAEHEALLQCLTAGDREALDATVQQHIIETLSPLLRSGEPTAACSSEEGS